MNNSPSPIAYSQFITYQIAIGCGVIKQGLSYDMAWAKAGLLYVLFCDSEFNVPSKSEKDGIVDFIQEEKRKLVEAEAVKKLEGSRTITVTINRSYSKSFEVKLELPKKSTLDEIRNTLEVSKSLEEELEDGLGNSSLNGGASYIEFYDDLTFQVNSLNIN
jgi:hypothetical protein